MAFFWTILPPLLSLITSASIPASKEEITHRAQLPMSSNYSPTKVWISCSCSYYLPVKSQCAMPYYSHTAYIGIGVRSVL
jgi:hypothetical protein